MNSRLYSRVTRPKRIDYSTHGRSRESVVLPPLPEWANYSANPELQQELERCLKLRDGASRILPLAQNRLQQLDAIKTLFVTNEQVLLCLQRVQREKVEDARCNAISDVPNPRLSVSHAPVPRSRRHAQAGLAKLCLSDIRIPLIWRDGPVGVNMQVLMQRLFPQSQSLLTTAGLLAGSGDSADRLDTGEQCDGYAVFCLARLGHTIRETRLIFDIRPGTSDVEFDDKLTFDNISEDFRLVLEVYAYPPSNSSRALPMFSRRRTLLLDNPRRPVDQLDLTQGGGKGAVSFSSYFELVGRCVASLRDLQNRVRPHAMTIGPQLLLAPPSTVNPSVVGSGTLDGSSASSLATSPDYSSEDHPHGSLNGSLNVCTYTSDVLFDGGSGGGQNDNGLPLFGSLCYRLVAQPHSAHKPLRTGWMWIRKLTASPAQLPAKLYWCELRDRHLWAYSSAEKLPDSRTPPALADVLSTSIDTETRVSDRSMDPVPECEDSSDYHNEVSINLDPSEGHRKSVGAQSVSSETCVCASHTYDKQQLTSSTPQIEWEPFKSDGRQRVLTAAPSSMKGTQSNSADHTPHVLCLALAITPKTLFLDSGPILRTLSVCAPNPSQQVSTPPLENSTRLTRETLPLITVSNFATAPAEPSIHSPPTRRLFRSPKIPRHLRTIKTQIHSRSLTNLKQLSSHDLASENDHSLHANANLSMTLPARARSARPSLEERLPWFTPCNVESQSQTIDGEVSLRSKSATNLLEVSSFGGSAHNVDVVGHNDLWLASKPKRFWHKIAIAQTLPRFSRDMKYHRSWARDTLSRSLDQLPNQNLLSPCHLSRFRTMDPDKTFSSTDVESVISEPALVHPDLGEGPSPSDSVVGEYSLYTFRIATTTRVLETTSAQLVEPSSTADRGTLGCCCSLSEVFEFAVSKPSLQELLQSTSDGPSAQNYFDNNSAPFADEKSTQLWLAMLQSHVAEQHTWGPDAFSKSVYIPTAPSTARDAGTRRSLAFY